MDGYNLNGMVADGGIYPFSVSAKQGFTLPAILVRDRSLQPICCENNISIYKVENVTQNHDVSISTSEQLPMAIDLTTNFTMDYGTIQEITAFVQLTGILDKYTGITWSVQNGMGLAMLTNEINTSATFQPIQAGTVTVMATSIAVPSISWSVEIIINKLTSDVTLLTAVSVVYQETLAQAFLIGATANGYEGSFIFMNSDIKLDAQDSSRTHQIQFAPKEMVNYNTVVGDSIPVAVCPKNRSSGTRCDKELQ